MTENNTETLTMVADETQDNEPLFIDTLTPEDRAASDARYTQRTSDYLAFRQSLGIKMVHTKLDDVEKPENVTNEEAVELTEEEKQEEAIMNGTAPVQVPSEIVEEKAW